MPRFFLALLLIAQASAQEATPDRPNILFAIADDWGWPHASAYGDAVVRTPTFDRIAGEGVLFEQAFVSSPSCTPSRNAILTGQHFFRLGQGANLWSTLAAEHPVFPLLLEEQGYHVGHWRKAWGPGDWKALGRDQNPAGKSYRSFKDFLEARPEGAPFCFWLGAHDPHRGYKWQSGAASGIDLAEIELPPPYPDSEKIRHDVADYYFEVQRFDRDVGEALEALKVLGELEDTLVVMTGDHGWPFPRGKTNLYDLGSRVPLAIRWGDRIAAGGRRTELVSLVDLSPTFLEAAGIPIPGEVTGTSLLKLLDGEVEDWRQHVVLGRERHTVAQESGTGGYPMRGIRTHRWLYIENLEPSGWPAGWEAPGSRPFRDCDNGPTKSFLLENRQEFGQAFELCFGKRPAVELYDLDRDPFQLSNLAGKEETSDIRAELAGRLEAELARLEDPRAVGGAEVFTESPYRGRTR